MQEIYVESLPHRQPRSQDLSPTRRETLVGSGHVSPKIWEITNKRFGGGADKCEICLCNSVPDLVLKVMTSQDKTSNAENNAQNPLTAKA